MLRRQEYWSRLSGATGQLDGTRYTWPFAEGWKRARGDAREHPARRLIDLLRYARGSGSSPASPPSRDEGYGTFSSTANVGSSD